MTNLVPFFLILVLATLSSQVLRRLHIPWVVLLIVGGVLLGPSVLGLVEPTDSLLFMSEIGLIFLMFMAGLETKVTHARAELESIGFVAVVNSLFPFGVGFWISHLLGMSTVSSVLVGIIFMSSSVAVIVPALESSGVLHKKLGRFILSSTLIQDALSLVLLSVLMQTQGFGAGVPIWLLYSLVFIVFVTLRWIVPKVNKNFLVSLEESTSKDLFQKEVRWVVAVLVGVVSLFGFLGLHPIIGAFLAGLILSDSISSERLYEQLRTVSYGIFIPTFFVMTGVKIDISVFAQFAGVGLMAFVLVMSSLSSKYLSGYLAARITKFNSYEANIIASSSMPQLSTTLAVAYLGLERNLISEPVVLGLVLLSIISTLLGPLILSSQPSLGITGK